MAVALLDDWKEMFCQSALRATCVHLSRSGRIIPVFGEVFTFADDFDDTRGATWIREFGDRQRLWRLYRQGSEIEARHSSGSAIWLVFFRLVHRAFSTCSQCNTEMLDTIVMSDEE